MCQAIIAPHNRIDLIRYFTARINSRPANRNGPQRQDIYLRALEAYIPELQKHEGQFKTRKKLKWTTGNPSQRVEIWNTEEKGSDVNLAVHLVNDAWQNRFDVAVVVSNDSDLVEALSIVRDMGKTVGLLTCVHRPAQELRRIAQFHRRIKTTHLKNSQLPNPIPGTSIRKPSTW